MEPGIGAADKRAAIDDTRRFSYIMLTSQAGVLEQTEGGNMRIQSVQFQDDDLFGDAKIDFADHPGTHFHFLVGENGSGKSQLLSEILNVRHLDPGRRTRNGKSTISVALETGDEVRVVNESSATKVVPASIGDSHQDAIDGAKMLRSDPGELVHLPSELPISEDVSASFTPPTGKAPNGQDLGRLDRSIPQALAWLKAHDDHRIVAQIDATMEFTASDHEHFESSDQRFRDACSAMFGQNLRYVGTETDGVNTYSPIIASYGKKMPLGSLSTGEQQMFYKLGQIALIGSNFDSAVLLFDEPELGLHPGWQVNFIDAVTTALGASGSYQIIVATHSPFTFHALRHNTDECIKLQRTEQFVESTVVDLSLTVAGGPLSTSLVAYEAFGIRSPELHIELFDRMKSRHDLAAGKISSISGFDQRIENDAPLNNKVKQANRSVSGKPTFGTGNFSSHETTPSWIRNKIHHPDEPDRKQYTPQDYDSSIEYMLSSLRTKSQELTDCV